MYSLIVFILHRYILNEYVYYNSRNILFIFKKQLAYYIFLITKSQETHLDNLET